MELKYLCQSLAALSTSPSLPQAPCCSACKSLSVFFFNNFPDIPIKSLDPAQELLVVPEMYRCYKNQFLHKGPLLKVLNCGLQVLKSSITGPHFTQKSFFSLEKFLTSSPLNKIPFMQALKNEKICNYRNIFKNMNPFSPAVDENLCVVLHRVCEDPKRSSRKFLLLLSLSLLRGHVCLAGHLDWGLLL